MPKNPKVTLCIDDYDCLGFDLDHTLVRYNVGPMIRLEYDLLAEFLIQKKGYDPAIKTRTFDEDRDFVCKGLTLDCERGNLLRLAVDGFILSACHGTKRLNDAEIERMYGRCRKKHPGLEYTQHLTEFGPQKMVDFGPVVHSFMDYFDIAAPLLCARVVDVIDQLNNGGKPMDEYFFWPDVQEGLRDMFMRTNFANDQGGYFPEIKAHPEKYILKRNDAFRDWLTMLRAHGKYLYVITGSHYDFASHVASYALGEDWKDLFDIVIFFARKPSFFVEDKRPFWRLDGAKEIESFEGWEDLETGAYYTQGNWKQLYEFFEYVTEWEPSNSLYFGDNVLQDVLAPKKFTTTIDTVAVCEDLYAEGMVDHPPTHPYARDIGSTDWGSFFFSPDPRIVRKKGTVLGRASSFKKILSSSTHSSPEGSLKSQSREDEVRRAISLRRIAHTPFQTPRASVEDLRSASCQSPARYSIANCTTPRSSLETVSRGGTPVSVPSGTPPKNESSIEDPPSSYLITGAARINTLWGTFIRDYAKMCIPDLDVLCEYPIDFKFPSFGRNKKGALTSSGFFPDEPLSLHTVIPLHTAIV